MTVTLTYISLASLVSLVGWVLLSLGGAFFCLGHGGIRLNTFGNGEGKCLQDRGYVMLALLTAGHYLAATFACAMAVEHLRVIQGRPENKWTVRSTKLVLSSAFAWMVFVSLMLALHWNQL